MKVVHTIRAQAVSPETNTHQSSMPGYAGAVYSKPACA